jgi:hypothetical protein
VVLTSNAVCGIPTGQTALTWTVRNNADIDLAITGDARGLSFAPNPIPPNSAATATELIDGPTANEQLTENVTFDPPTSGGISEISATVTVPGCTGPEPPPGLLAFTNDASVAAAAVGDTVSYSYCAQNTSDVPVEVVQVVDDRVGVLALPADPIVVAPGETLCNTDLGLPVGYTVTANDAGTTVVNNAVVTIRTVEPEPRMYQATDEANVEIQGFRMPPTRLMPGPVEDLAETR